MVKNGFQHAMNKNDFDAEQSKVTRTCTDCLHIYILN